MVVLKYVIEPGHGWKNGEFDPGACVGTLHEWQLAWVFAKTLADELEENACPHQLIDNRNRQYQLLDPSGFVISIHLANQAKVTGYQTGSIQESPVSRDLLALMEKWGAVTSSRWNGAKVRLGASAVLRVEPFDLGEWDALLFAERLPALAREFGRFLGRESTRCALRLR